MEGQRRAAVRAAVWAVVVTAVALSAQPGSLNVERQGDHLRLSAPSFHFLEGRPLERLRNGAAVPYLFTVTIEPVQGGGRTTHLQRRFVVSYDLWEEKFAIVQEGRPPRSVSHLSAAAAEAWCLDSLLPGLPSLPAEKSFVVKLACSVAADEEPPTGDGLTLSTLIEFFSRKGAAPSPRWELASAPLRLADLKDRSRR